MTTLRTCRRCLGGLMVYGVPNGQILFASLLPPGFDPEEKATIRCTCCDTPHPGYEAIAISPSAPPKKKRFRFFPVL